MMDGDAAHHRLSDAGGDPHWLAGQGPEEAMKCDADILQLIAVSADWCLLPVESSSQRYFVSVPEQGMR